MSDFLLCLWIALIGADRIDLAGGKVGFALTPFLALTPLVLVSEIVRHARQRRTTRVSRRAVAYAMLAGALVSVAMASVFVAGDFSLSASRAMLLAFNVLGTLAVALLCADREQGARILALGAIAGLGLFVVFNIMEVFWWIGSGAETIRLGPALLHFGALQNVGPVPRLGGPVADANRGGFVLLFYAVVIAAGVRRPVARRMALSLVIVLLALTISRSAWLGAFTLLVVAMVSGEVRSPLGLWVAGATVATAVAALLLVAPDAVGRAVRLVTSPAAERLATSEGSGQSHLALIQRGIGEATQSIPRAFTGLGYGTSNLVLQDVFPGNKYGNFHSLYVSMFAESGVLALLLTLVLMLTPIAAGGPWRPMIAGAIAFNIFYQTPTEPAFWFTLAAAWLTIPPRRRVRV